MMRRLIPSATAMAMALTAMSVLATAARADRPPPDAKPLSEILRMLEASGDVAYFDEIEWDDGYWEVEYVRSDGARVEVKIHPVSGEARR